MKYLLIYVVFLFSDVIFCQQEYAWVYFKDKKNVAYFINNPTVYPTTVGLYNDNNDLLAVAKLSKPIQKDFTKEALVRVKLDF